MKGVLITLDSHCGQTMTCKDNEKKDEEKDVRYETPIWWKDLMKDIYTYETQNESR